MRGVRWTRRLLTPAALALSAGCAHDVTAPPPSAARQPATGALGHGVRRDTYVSGNSITATGDDGTTLTLDQSAAQAVLIVQGQSLPVSPEVADTLHNIFMRMYTAEQQATYVQSNGVSGGGVVPASGPPPWQNIGSGNCPGDPLAIVCSSSVRGRTRAARIPTEAAATSAGRASRSYVIGATRVTAIWGVAGGPRVPSTTTTMSGTTTGAWASYDLAYSPTISCTDISMAIYNEMPNFRAAKTALLSAIGANALNILSMTKGLPPTIEPGSWLGWSRLYGAGLVMDGLFANFESSRTKLGTYAAIFNANDCIHDTTPDVPPVVGGAGGVGGGPPTCYDAVYYYLDTGEIFDEEGIGCW